MSDDEFAEAFSQVRVRIGLDPWEPLCAPPEE